MGKYHNVEITTHNAIKINVDGGFILPKCSAAAVARNSDGKFLGCSTLTSTCTSPLEAEAIAYRLGSQFASRFEADHVIIEGDSKTVVQAIMSTNDEIPWRIRNFISDIRYFQSVDNRLHFAFIKREANVVVAHSLAKFA
ncbi:hypothetical protein BVC80_9023g33 [Macleaya cordata]|uniref:RNase H type-1 domain-containing protein n=1 Tax=Macleaya cordata TaxID=56857 RepID=A0A200QV70_MACCD|nr:hypothetical protein BVC80_9023g33 [Macleaya cordata]